MEVRENEEKIVCRSSGLRCVCVRVSNVLCNECRAMRCGSVHNTQFYAMLSSRTSCCSAPNDVCVCRSSASPE